MSDPAESSANLNLGSAISRWRVTGPLAKRSAPFWYTSHLLRPLCFPSDLARIALSVAWVRTLTASTPRWAT